MALASYEFSFNGVTGGSTRFVFVDENGIDGLRSLPGVRTTDVSRPDDEGDFAGYDFLTGRTLTMNLVVLPDGTGSLGSLEANFAAVEAAFAKQPGQLVTLLPFSVKMAGWANSRRSMCRVRRFEAATSIGFTAGAVKVAVQLDSPDPRLLDDSLSSTSVGLPTGAGGVAFPLTFPLTFGASTSGGTMSLTNSGNFPAVPQLTFTGPCDAPKATNQTSGEFLVFDLSLGTGDYLTVDMGAKTALLNGTASRRGSLVPGSSWWQLSPGASVVQFTAAAYNSSASLAVSFRSSWV